MRSIRSASNTSHFLTVNDRRHINSHEVQGEFRTLVCMHKQGEAGNTERIRFSRMAMLFYY